MIKTNLMSVPQENQLKIKLEEFDGSLDKIQRFLGVKHNDLAAKIYNSAEQRYSLKNTSDWTDAMKSDYERIISDELYDD